MEGEGASNVTPVSKKWGCVLGFAKQGVMKGRAGRLRDPFLLSTGYLQRFGQVAKT